MATSHALKELAVCLTFVLIPRSFHPPVTKNAELSIYRTDVKAFYASTMASAANYKVLVPNMNSSSNTKMAEVSKTKQLRVLLNYLKLTLIAELNMSLGLLACGDIATNPVPITGNQNEHNAFKLPAKGLWSGQWNVNYLTKIKLVEIKMHIGLGQSEKPWHPGDNRDVFLQKETVGIIQHSWLWSAKKRPSNRLWRWHHCLHQHWAKYFTSYWP